VLIHDLENFLSDDEDELLESALKSAGAGFAG
jgi:hypothetical protein